MDSIALCGHLIAYMRFVKQSDLFDEKNHWWMVLFCFMRALWRDGMEKAPQAMLEGLWYVRFTKEKDYSSTFT